MDEIFDVDNLFLLSKVKCDLLEVLMQLEDEGNAKEDVADSLKKAVRRLSLLEGNLVGIRNDQVGEV